MPTPLPDQDAARKLVRDRIAELGLSVKHTERLAGLSGGSLHGFLKPTAPEGISATTLFAVFKALGVRAVADTARFRMEPVFGAEPPAAKSNKPAAAIKRDRKPAVVPDKRAKAVEFRAAGLSYREIGKRLGCSGAYVCQLVKKSAPAT
jgi:hypothetical protein